MNWREFINELFNQDLKLSSLEVEAKTGIRQPVIDRWKKGEVGKPQRNTIRRLEEGLNIKINDRDPQNITYQKLPGEPKYKQVDYAIYEYPVLSNVYGGNSSQLFVAENITEYVTLPYGKKENVFAIRIINDGMKHIIEKGDIILVDMEKEIVNNDIVIAIMKNGNQFIKRFKKLKPNLIMLYSTNDKDEPITASENEIEAIYKLVGVWKQL